MQTLILAALVCGSIFGPRQDVDSLKALLQLLTLTDKLKVEVLADESESDLRICITIFPHKSRFNSLYPYSSGDQFGMKPEIIEPLNAVIGRPKTITLTQKPLDLNNVFEACA